MPPRHATARHATSPPAPRLHPTHPVAVLVILVLWLLRLVRQLRRVHQEVAVTVVAVPTAVVIAAMTVTAAAGLFISLVREVGRVGAAGAGALLGSGVAAALAAGEAGGAPSAAEEAWASAGMVDGEMKSCVRVGVGCGLLEGLARYRKQAAHRTRTHACRTQ